eukprot:tig00000480_g1339.t1
MQSAACSSSSQTIGHRAGGSRAIGGVCFAARPSAARRSFHFEAGVSNGALRGLRVVAEAAEPDFNEHSRFNIVIIDPESGKDYEFKCDSGTTILDAAIDAGVPVPHDCFEGHCETCVALMKSGAVSQHVEPSPYLAAYAKPSSPTDLDDDGESPVEEFEGVTEGLILTCVSYPDEDCVLELPFRGHSA